MSTRFQLAKNYLSYFLRASNGKGHGIHSPFVFDFVQNVLNDRREFYSFERIEQLRKKLLIDERLVAIRDFGAGSIVTQNRNRPVSEIAKYSSVSPRFGKLLFRIVHHYGVQRMIELGTSLGISSAYLGSGNENAALWTIEGDPNIAAIAASNFKELALPNIELVRGSFEEKLTKTIHQLTCRGKFGIELAFIDGNHRKEPVLRYFDELLHYMSESSVIILDDIHWSKEMNGAWTTIKNDQRVLLTIDLFFFGLVFFRQEFVHKQDFTIYFPR
ncbi:MAG: SAM-dependent methyltransferase [Bacteroidetes bacterium]|nr:MAG: SAM-dependent methyltransferase [Bacteroidota bacterium]